MFRACFETMFHYLIMAIWVDRDNVIDSTWNRTFKIDAEGLKISHGCKKDASNQRRSTDSDEMHDMYDRIAVA